MVGVKKLKAIAREEAKTAREYRKWGFVSQAKDEARHSKFFKAKAKGWHNESFKHHLAAHGIKTKDISNRRMNLYKAQKDIVYNFPTKEDAKKEINAFESMKDNAELRALQAVSLERHLDDKEFMRFKELANKKLEGKL